MASARGSGACTGGGLLAFGEFAATWSTQRLSTKVPIRQVAGSRSLLLKTSEYLPRKHDDEQVFALIDSVLRHHKPTR